MSENGKIEWYLARDGQQHGPLSEIELDKFIELGHLKPTDLLWRVGFDDWRPAAEVMPDPVLPDIRQAGPAPRPGSTAAAIRADSSGRQQPAAVSDVEPHPAHVSAHEAASAAGYSAVALQRGRIASPVETTRFGEPVRTFGDTTRDPAIADPVIADPVIADPVIADPVGSAVTIRPDQLQPPITAGQAGPEPQPEWHSQPRHHPGAQLTARSPGDARHDATRHESKYDTPDGVVDDDYDDEPAGRGGWLVVAAALFVAVLLGAAGLFAYNNQKLLSSYLADLTARRPATEVAVVKAPREAAREAVQLSERNVAAAAPDRVAKLDQAAPTPLGPAGPAQPATAKPVPELPLLKSKLWQFAQQEFGEWVEKRMAELRQLSADDKTQEESNNHLVQSFVTFRRQNAAIALLASPDDLAGVAHAFVDSLEALKSKGAEPCYELISNGEGSPVLTKLYFEPQIGAKLEAQMLAIMKAVAGGKSNNATRLPPAADDFSTLSKELGKRGWTAADLKLFSDPNALSGAEPQVVCRLVTEWFATQTTLQDARTRDQLIAASLRPVIGG